MAKHSFKTASGLDCYEAISALQKYIRRGEEFKAMRIAFDYITDDPKQRVYLWDRLRVIAMEDVGIATPEAVSFVAACHENFDRFWAKRKVGPCKLSLANAVLFLSRAEKTRMADHAQAATVHANSQEQPPIEDWTLDGHTRRGRKKKRGLKYFMKESTQLANPWNELDPYVDLAYRAWKEDATDPGWF